MTIVHNQVHNTLKQIYHKQSAIHLKKTRHFDVNDWVLVDRRNLQVKAGNNRSLTNGWIAPYKVRKAIGSHACQLAVPEGTRWHNVVHTILLKPCHQKDEPQYMDKDEPDVYKV